MPRRMGLQRILGHSNRRQENWEAALNAQGDLQQNEPTTLDDLIPENNGNNTRPPMNPPTTEPPQVEAQRAAGPGNPVSKKTPISPYPTLTYGLQETHTTILPWNGWITAAGLDKTTPLQLKVRMNSPYGMLDIQVLANAGAGGDTVSKGFYRAPLGHRGQATNQTYPVQMQRLHTSEDYLKMLS